MSEFDGRKRPERGGGGGGGDDGPGGKAPGKKTHTMRIMGAPPSVAFPKVKSGGMGPAQKVVLTNISPEPVKVEKVVEQGATHKGEFDLRTDGFEVGPWESKTTSMLFVPVGEGDRKTRFRLLDEDGDEAGAVTAHAHVEPAGEGPGSVDGLAGILDASPRSRPPGFRLRMDEAERDLDGADATIARLRDALIPAYTKARDAIDPASVGEIGGNVVVARQKLRASLEEIEKVLPTDDPRFHMSMPGEPAPDGEDRGRLEGLKMRRQMILSQLEVVDLALAVELGPQKFRGHPVAGSVVVTGMGSRPERRLADEVRRVREMLSLVAEARKALRGDSPSSSLVADFADRVAAWKSRPMDYEFIVAVIEAAGLWFTLANAGGHGPGHDLEATERATRMQAQHTGMMGDVGAFDAADAHLELTIGGRESAERVFAMVMSAQASTRVALLQQLRSQGQLFALCEPLPWAKVKVLHDSLGTTSDKTGEEIKSFLQTYFLSKDQWGTSLEHYEGTQSAASFYDSHGLDTLHTVHNFASFGFLDQYSAAYDAKEQGLITNDEYRGYARNATLKAGAVGAVSMIGGSVAGELAGGATEGLLGTTATTFTGRVAIGTATGMAGGAAGGAGAVFASDAVDIATGYKDSFSSASDYKHAALGGALYGGAIGGGTVAAGAALGPAAARYLPAGFVTRAQALAQRFIQHEEFLMQTRALGRGAGIRVRLRVAEILEMEGSGLFPPGTGGMALAAAGGGDTVMLDVEAVRPMGEPVSGAEPDAPPFKAIKAERLPDESAIDDLLGEGQADKMHIIDGDEDSARLAYESKASGPSNKVLSGPRSANAKMIPPPGDAFIEWFDALSPAQLEELLADPSAAKVIKRSIRHPGREHEWVMVRHMRQAKRWGVSMRTVLDARTKTALTVGKHFRHGGTGSDTMHRQLSNMILEADNFAAFKDRLNVWADEELFPVRGPNGEPPLGRYYLPSELQVRAEGGGAR